MSTATASEAPMSLERHGIARYRMSASAPGSPILVPGRPGEAGAPSV